MDAYWITRIDIIHKIFGIITILSGATSVSCIFIMILYTLAYNANDAMHIIKRILKWSIPIFIIAGLIVLFLPTKEELLSMISQNFNLTNLTN